MRNRKWTLAVWGMGLGTLISIVALRGWWIDKDGAAGILVQGLGIITAVFTLYSAANIVNKNVTGNITSDTENRGGG